MKVYKLIPLFFIGAMLGFAIASPGVSVVAQVPTSTMTFIPPSVTPTLNAFNCPIGTPAGWGTYTPSAMWLVECGNCGSVVTSTPTALPTGTPNPTYVYQTQAACQTAPVGGEACYTATPNINLTPSITPSPTATLSAYSMNFYQVDFVSIQGGGSPTNVVNSYTASPELNVNSHLYTFTGSYSATDTSGLYNAYLQYQFRIDGLAPSGNQTIYISWLYSSGTNVQSYGGSTLLSNSTSVSLPFNSQLLLPMRVYASSGNSYTGNFSGSFTLWVSTYPYDPFATSTPTPTPTGTPYFDTGYCSSVAPTVSEFGFDLFIPDGSPNCAMGWDSFGVGEYTVPAVQICLQPSQFGVIRLFNEDYEVGIYGLAAAAAFLWRYFRTV